MGGLSCRLLNPVLASALRPLQCNSITFRQWFPNDAKRSSNFPSSVWVGRKSHGSIYRLYEDEPDFHRYPRLWRLGEVERGYALECLLPDVLNSAGVS